MKVKTGSDISDAIRSALGVSVMGPRMCFGHCRIRLPVCAVHDHVYYWDTVVNVITCRRLAVMHDYMSMSMIGRLQYMAAYI